MQVKCMASRQNETRCTTHTQGRRGKESAKESEMEDRMEVTNGTEESGSQTSQGREMASSIPVSQPGFVCHPVSYLPPSLAFPVLLIGLPLVSLIARVQGQWGGFNEKKIG